MNSLVLVLDRLQELAEVGVFLYLNKFPVVESCTPERPGVHRKPQGVDEMQLCTTVSTQSDDGARVRWNLWFKKYDVKHFRIFLDCSGSS